MRRDRYRQSVTFLPTNPEHTSVVIHAGAVRFRAIPFELEMETLQCLEQCCLAPGCIARRAFRSVALSSVINKDLSFI